MVGDRSSGGINRNPLCASESLGHDQKRKEKKRLPLSLRLDAGSTLLAFPVIYRK